MNDIEIPNPNYRQMNISLFITLFYDEEYEPIIMPPTLDSEHTPPPTINDVPVRVICDHDNLGLIFGYFYDIYRVYLKDILPITSCPKIKVLRKKFRGY